jgi:serine/threonine protein kinase/tetratricopeptide (TPR) repeat protein
MTKMSPVEAIFFAALEKSTAEERGAYLDEACGGDAELRRRVERLLAAHPEVGSCLEPPHLTQPEVRPPGSDPRAPAAEAGVVLAGRYKLLEAIGEGGMGTVWMARQAQPVKRLVAVKLIKADMDSKQVIARFEAERQALALMDHPNIARVLDAGATDAGRPYFVMDLVKGVPITRYCDERRLTPRQRLELFLPVCQAVQHAHQKGIIHRDLKPSNILIALYDGRPVPKVIDFGVAKAAGQPLTDKTLVTGFGAIVGTLEYMSPEQAEINQLDIDTRSDVYSLGVLLYELLTGSPPFTRKELRRAGVLEMLRVIREQEPTRPSTKLSTADGLQTLATNRGTEPARLTRLVRGELDWVVMKALEKDRTRRYESANALARDVERYLADEPVQACPPSTWYRLRKFGRRNKGLLAATLLVATSLVVGTVVSVWQAIRAVKAEALAQQRLEGEQEQRTLAQQNAADAEAARQEAVANLHQAREAVDQMLTRVSEEKLLNTPQMELLRKALLEDALSFYRRFSRQPASDPAVRRGVGEAYRRTGHIYLQIGRPDQAERACREAIAVFENLAADSPADPADRLALALSHQERGDAFHRLGQYAAAEAALRQAIGLMRGLTADFPGHEGYRRSLAAMENCLAEVSERLVQVATKEKAEGVGREDLQRQERLLSAAPNDPHRRHAVASARMELGRTLFADRPQEAERLFRDAVAGYAKLAGEFPHTARYRTDLASAYHDLFLLLRTGRRFEEAEAVLRQQRPGLEKLIADAPSLAYPRRLLVDHYWDYGLMLEAAGRPREAGEAFRQAVARAESTWAAFPAYAWTPGRLAFVYNHVGNTHQAAGRLSEAEAAYRKALGVSERAVRALPQAELRCRLADSCLNLGLLLLTRGRDREATSVFRKLFEPDLVSAAACNSVAWRLATDAELKLRPTEIAVECARKAVELAPEDGAVWNTLGVAQYRAGNWQASIDALRKAMGLRRGGNGLDWFFLAMAHWHLGGKDEARKWYDQGVRWMEKNKPAEEELRRFRAEAAELLGIEKKKD